MTDGLTPGKEGNNIRGKRKELYKVKWLFSASFSVACHWRSDWGRPRGKDMGAPGSFSKKLKRLFHHLCSFGDSELELLNSQIQKHLILNYSNSFFYYK